jgi:hypothetical protein
MLALAVMTAGAAYGQFSLFWLNGGVETPVATAFDLGAVNSGATASIAFRIRNISSNAATLSTLTVAGVGFTLAGPAAPVTVASQAALDFTVDFQGVSTGLYSAALEATGISVLLVAEVQQGLTYSVSTSVGWQPLTTLAPVDFGSAAPQSANTMHFLVQNPSALYLTVPALAVQGQGFGLSGPSPAGTLLSPQQTAAFDIAFTPPAGGTFSGSLQAGNYVFPLTGTGVAPPMPNPLVTVSLPQNASGQQGSVSLSFDGPAPSAAAGVLALAFQPLAAGWSDPAIAFASGAASLPFTLAAGDTQADFGGDAAPLFQTGTTAGTLVFTATLGGAAAQQSVVIPPAPVSIAAAQATRGSGSITVLVTAFDNTRTAGKLVYTFFDAQGNAAPPGAIAVDSTSDFAAYFAQSTSGGLFSLTAVFPVTGDATQVKAFQVQLINSVGTSSSQPIPF